MAVTIKQTESAPDSYPASGMSPEPTNATTVWQRIESYVARRWTEREVVWTVEGPGEWCPPLAPATVTTIEIWSRAAEWESVEIPAAPLGYWLPGSGPYRFTATVGDDEAPPAAVLEAFARLSAYMLAKPGKPGAYREAVTAGSVSVATSRASSWMASALQNSGAADLLRPYRRA